MSTWEERMSQRAHQRESSMQHRPDLKKIWDELPAQSRSARPPDDPTICRICYEWRAYPEGQKHFGYNWWRVCDSYTCDHPHHLGEIWIA